MIPMTRKAKVNAWNTVPGTVFQGIEIGKAGPCARLFAWAACLRRFARLVYTSWEARKRDLGFCRNAGQLVYD